MGRGDCFVKDGDPHFGLPYLLLAYAVGRVALSFPVPPPT